MGQPIRACPFKRTDERRAENCHVDEIVEVPRLERCILAIVGERQQLLAHCPRARCVAQH